MIYFDNAATTKPCEEAAAAVMKGLECFGNPSSLHGVGLEAEKLLTSARGVIARSIGASEDEIYFTSGATESNNTAIFGAARTLGKRQKKIVTTSVEHPSVAVCCNELEKSGFEVVRISPREDSKIYAEDIISAVDENTCLVSCMLANNETGRIIPVNKVFAAIKKKFPRVITHCDCVQGYMKLPINVKKLGADIISLSAHKIHGPKGIGAIYIKKGVHIPSLLYGGGQEKNFRSGTESIPLICGFSAAVEKYSHTLSARYEKVSKLREHLFELCEQAEDVYVISDEECSPYVSSIAVKGLKSEVLLHYLESRGVYVSSGSACSKGKKSSVIKEFGVAENLQDFVLRISFSSDNELNEVDELMNFVKDAQNTLAKIK